MAAHGRNKDGDYTYHHCAELQIRANPNKPIDTRFPAENKQRRDASAKRRVDLRRILPSDMTARQILIVDDDVRLACMLVELLTGEISKCKRKFSPAFLKLH